MHYCQLLLVFLVGFREIEILGYYLGLLEIVGARAWKKHIKSTEENESKVLILTRNLTFIIRVINLTDAWEHSPDKQSESITHDIWKAQF